MSANSSPKEPTSKKSRSGGMSETGVKAGATIRESKLTYEVQEKITPRFAMVKHSIAQQRSRTMIELR